ncbi:hypothetical protein RSAG8_13485, partial [Rhizoctonia solani AG-8 WAC10335]
MVRHSHEETPPGIVQVVGGYNFITS